MQSGVTQLGFGVVEVVIFMGIIGYQIVSALFKKKDEGEEVSPPPVRPPPPSRKPMETVPDMDDLMEALGKPKKSLHQSPPVQMEVRRVPLPPPVPRSPLKTPVPSRPQEPEGPGPGMFERMEATVAQEAIRMGSLGKDEIAMAGSGLEPEFPSVGDRLLKRLRNPGEARDILLLKEILGPPKALAD